MEEFRIILSPRAGAELEAIHAYIARESADRASDMVARLMEGIDSLKHFPHRTRVLPQRGRARYPVRSLPVGPYVVYFRAIDDERVVHVVHVQHGARQAPRSFE